MNRPPKKTIAAALGGMFLTFASTAYAAGLGKLSVISSLGQPLSAEIDLVSLQPGEFEVLTARVASPEAYTDARIEYSPLLRQLRFSVERKSDGKPILKITSGGAINEPFLDVLVEMTWPSGRLVREYPILLDPPGFNEAKIQAPVAAVQTQRPAAPVAAAPAPAAPSGAGLPSARAESAPKGDTYGPVKRGDTLAKIATEMKGDGISLDQMLVALFRENKQAFGNGNMNLLKTGQILRIPSAAEVAKITRDDAQKEVRVQVADWKAYREQIAGTVATAAAKPAASNVATGQVAAAKPVAPPPAASTDQLKIAKAETSAQAGATGAKGGAEAAKAAAKEDAVAKEKTLAEAKARIAELEKQKADAQKLVQLKAAPAAPAADAKPAQVAQAPAAVTPPATAPTAAPEAAKPADVPKAEAPKPAPPKVAAKTPPPPPPEPELLDTVMDNLPIIAGVGGAGLLAVGGFVFMRRRKAGAGSNSSMTQTSSLMPSDLKPNSETGAKAGGLVDTGNSSFLTDFDKAGPGAIDTDEVDPVAEAEVYIAYGRDAQAEEILKEAMMRDKGRHEISMKLLEIYHARKSAPAFETVARELKEAIGESDPMWAKAASMGASIDPTNGLYSGAAANYEATGTFAAGGAMADASAEADQKPDLDFDLGFDDSATTQMPAATVDITSPATDQPAPAEPNAALDFDLDLGAGTSDVPTTAVDTPSEPGGLDFDLALDSPAEAAPAAAPSATAVPSSSGFDFDLSSLSLEEPGAAPSIDLSVAEPAAKASPAPAPSLDLSDLSLDLDSPAGSPAATDVLDSGGVATKLELAKAYVEIGDTDGAKEILLEVTREGSAAQQDEAKKILAGL